jgi:peptide/nickel transport system permease protein
MSVTWWPWYTRLARARCKEIKEENFVEAAQAMGVPKLKIILRHILPNSLSPLLVAMSMDMGWAILTCAYLGFIGLGAQPPEPEWGLMVSIGRRFVSPWWWYPIFPGLAIIVLVLGFNLLGDGMRDVLDPEMRHR